jgi:hypothetical protein
MPTMLVLKRVLFSFTVICLLAVASIALNNSSRARPGEDLSELQDTFWLLAELQGTRSDFSGIVIDIERYGITFSAPQYIRSLPFEYKTTTMRLKFYLAWAYSDVTKSNRSRWLIARQFEKVLQEIRSYDLRDGRLTFLTEGAIPSWCSRLFVKEGLKIAGGGLPSIATILDSRLPIKDWSTQGAQRRLLS